MRQRRAGLPRSTPWPPRPSCCRLLHARAPRGMHSGLQPTPHHWRASALRACICREGAERTFSLGEALTESAMRTTAQERPILMQQADWLSECRLRCWFWGDGPRRVEGFAGALLVSLLSWQAARAPPPCPALPAPPTFLLACPHASPPARLALLPPSGAPTKEVSGWTSRLAVTLRCMATELSSQPEQPFGRLAMGRAVYRPSPALARSLIDSQDKLMELHTWFNHAEQGLAFASEGLQLRLWDIIGWAGEGGPAAGRVPGRRAEPRRVLCARPAA